MSIVPNIADEAHDDLCLECGRDLEECICRDTFPDDFDPLGEDDGDPDWDLYLNDLETDDGSEPSKEDM